MVFKARIGVTFYHQLMTVSSLQSRVDQKKRIGGKAHKETLKKTGTLRIGWKEIFQTSTLWAEELSKIMLKINRRTRISLYLTESKTKEITLVVKAITKSKMIEVSNGIRSGEKSKKGTTRLRVTRGVNEGGDGVEAPSEEGEGASRTGMHTPGTTSSP